MFNFKNIESLMEDMKYSIIEEAPLVLTIKEMEKLVRELDQLIIESETLNEILTIFTDN